MEILTILVNLLHPRGPACPDCQEIISPPKLQAAFLEFRRVQCHGCGRWFTARTGTALQGCKLKPGQIFTLLFLLGAGAEINRIAQAAGVSPQTVRVWKELFA